MSATRRGALPMYTVYRSPRDYPGEYVVRLWLIYRGVAEAAEVVARGHTLESVRDKLPPGLHCLGREPGDEPQIVEVWI